MLLANFATMALRMVAIFTRLRRGPRPVTSVPRLVDYKRLPRVSVLVPLWREARVAEQLLEALSAMEYPAPLLDIKLVLEEEDETTRAAIARSALPPTIEVVTVPADTLRTKPRAMNYALPFCRGEIVGVYDAEDKPDPGQIRAVVQHLMDAPPDVACVQGYLDFYNAGDNWLAALLHHRVRDLVPGAADRRAAAAGCRSRSAAPRSSSAAGRSRRSAPGTRTTSPRTPTSACGWRASATAAR